MIRRRLLAPVLFLLPLLLLSAAADARTYVMKPGDTLWDLANTYYGDPTVYPVFLELNNIDNPRTIPVGKEIIVPGYDEIRKIAAEMDPNKRKDLLEKARGGDSTVKEPEQPKPTPRPGEDPTPLDPRNTAFNQVISGQIDAAKLDELHKKVEASPSKYGKP